MFGSRVAPMPDQGSVTAWIRRLEEGDQAAAQPLWEAYFQRMVELARQRLPAHRRAAADEEDIALSAFSSVCRGLESNRFERLVSRESLWPLLVAITAQKTQDLLRREGRLKRGGGAHKVEDFDWENFLGREPDPQAPALLADELARVLDRLRGYEDEHFQHILWASLEGETTAEIAARLGCSRKTVQRKLAIIRGELLKGDPP
jgi:RNA polymerase sigma factor (sigma-70 family)